MCLFSNVANEYYLMFSQRCSKVFKYLVDCSIITVCPFDTQRCSNLVATFDQIYFVCQFRWHEFSIKGTHFTKGKLDISIKMWFFQYWKSVISNVLTTLQQSLNKSSRWLLDSQLTQMFRSQIYLITLSQYWLDMTS